MSCESGKTIQGLLVQALGAEFHHQQRESFWISLSHFFHLRKPCSASFTGLLHESPVRISVLAMPNCVSLESRVTETESSIFILLMKKISYFLLLSNQIIKYLKTTQIDTHSPSQQHIRLCPSLILIAHQFQVITFASLNVGVRQLLLTVCAWVWVWD